MVGKTNILLRLTKNNFQGDTRPTIGMDFMSEIIKLKKTLIN